MIVQRGESCGVSGPGHAGNVWSSPSGKMSLLHLGRNLLIHKRRASSLMSIENWDLTMTRVMLKQAFLRLMHVLSDSPLTPAES